MNRCVSETRVRSTWCLSLSLRKDVSLSRFFATALNKMRFVMSRASNVVVLVNLSARTKIKPTNKKCSFILLLLNI